MIPESIFITVDIDTAGKEYINIADEREYGRVKYVRATTLLKWAKDELKLSKDVEGVSEKSYEEGRQQVALNLIDKLELM